MDFIKSDKIVNQYLPNSVINKWCQKIKIKNSSILYEKIIKINFIKTTHDKSG